MRRQRQPRNSQPLPPVPLPEDLNEEAIKMGIVTKGQVIEHLKIAIGRDHYYVARREAEQRGMATNEAIRFSMLAMGRAIHFLLDGEE